MCVVIASVVTADWALASRSPGYSVGESGERSGVLH